jgi:hypothetical protein
VPTKSNVYPAFAATALTPANKQAQIAADKNSSEQRASRNFTPPCSQDFVILVWSSTTAEDPPVTRRTTLMTTAADLANGLTPTDSSPPRRPVFIVLAGRGGHGKTTIARLLCELCHAAGRQVIIADGDRTNRSLPKYFKVVHAPTSSDNHGVQKWLEALINEAILTRCSVVLDLGGNDMMLKHLAIEIELVELLEQKHGIDVAILHFIGPEVESLGYLASVEADPYLPEQAALFAPQRIALILNEGLVPETYTAIEAFATVREHPVFQAAVARGARTIVMPRLKALHEVNRRHLSFQAAANGATGNGLDSLGPTDRERVTRWLKEMDRAFAPIAEWLP